MANLRDVDEHTSSERARRDAARRRRIRLMHERRVGSVVIVDGVRPVGIVTERDDARRRRRRRPRRREGRRGDERAGRHGGRRSAVAGHASDDARSAVIDICRCRATTNLVGVVSLRDLAHRHRSTRPRSRWPARRRGHRHRSRRRARRGRLLPLPPVLGDRPGRAAHRSKTWPGSCVDGACPATSSERDAFAAELAAAACRSARGASALLRAHRGDERTARRTALGDAARRRARRHGQARRHRRRRAPPRRHPAHRRVPALAHGAATGLREGQLPVEPRPELGYAANYLWLLHGEEPSPEHAEPLSSGTSSPPIDHGFNALDLHGRAVALDGRRLRCAASPPRSRAQRAAARRRRRAARPARRDRLGRSRSTTSVAR